MSCPFGKIKNAPSRSRRCCCLAFSLLSAFVSVQYIWTLSSIYSIYKFLTQSRRFFFLCLGSPYVVLYIGVADFVLFPHFSLISSFSLPSFPHQNWPDPSEEKKKMKKPYLRAVLLQRYIYTVDSWGTQIPAHHRGASVSPGPVRRVLPTTKDCRLRPADKLMPGEEKQHLLIRTESISTYRLGRKNTGKHTRGRQYIQNISVLYQLPVIIRKR